MIIKHFFHKLGFVCKPVFRNCTYINYCKYSTNFKIVRMEKNKVVVSCDEDTDRIDLSLRYINENYGLDRIFKLNRFATESCSKVVLRLTENILKFIAKKKNKKKSIDVNVVANLIHKEDKNIENMDNYTCLAAFVENKDNFALSIDDEIYEFDVNPPFITTVSLTRSSIMVGFYLFVTKLECLHCDPKDSIVKWYKSEGKFETSIEAKSRTHKWHKFDEGMYVIPTNDEVGRLIKVSIQPRNGSRLGQEVETTSSVIVSARPEECPFERRHSHTPPLMQKDELRVISYNILADLYADSDFSRKNLFPTCPSYALATDYRQQLLIKELIGYNGDVICLQEVDSKLFKKVLTPILEAKGYKGLFHSKGSINVPEGLAMYYFTNKLSLLESMSFHLSQELSSNPIFEDIHAKLLHCKKALEEMNNRNTVLQVNVFACASEPSKLLVIGNTHLYFRPDADHIRLLQAGLCLRILHHVCTLWEVQENSRDVSLVFSGDFNSCPENAVYRLMTSQYIDEDDVDWKSRPDEPIEGLSLSHQLELSSACGTPAYTNYTRGFHGCLDYIFYQSNMLKVIKMIPFQSHEEVTQYEAIPSVVFPSDHIALIADLKWNK